MLAGNVTVGELDKALEKTNERYEGNLIWKRSPERVGRRFRFTLTVKTSKGKGGRRGHSGRRIAAACYHAHGDFFDNLLEIQPEAFVLVAGAKGQKRIDIDGGNWEDYNLGSNWRPLYASEACDCWEWDNPSA